MKNLAQNDFDKDNNYSTRNSNNYYNNQNYNGGYNQDYNQNFNQDYNQGYNQNYNQGYNQNFNNGIENSDYNNGNQFRKMPVPKYVTFFMWAFLLTIVLNGSILSIILAFSLNAHIKTLDRDRSKKYNIYIIVSVVIAVALTILNAFL